ncbi:MAG: hypothetical protein ACI4CS_04825 [Candidatus Weimeria sp.]
MAVYTYIFPLVGTDEAKELLIKNGYRAEKDETTHKRLTTDCPPEEFQKLYYASHNGGGADYGRNGRMDTIPHSKATNTKDIRKVFREEYKAHCTRVFLEVED